MKIIEEGWKKYRAMVVPANAGEVQIAETRQAFYAGAAVLFESLMRSLDPEKEPTANDMRIMDGLQAEIDEFGHSLDKRYLKPN